MPTVECKDCKKMVSTSAEVCPNCGAKFPASYIPSKVTVHLKPPLLLFQKVIISVDGRQIGELDKDESVTFDLPFGEHIIKAQINLFSVWSVRSGQISIRILPAKVYRIEVSLIDPGGFGFESYVLEV